LSNIDTLVRDIYALFDRKTEIPKEELEALGQEIAKSVEDALSRGEEDPPSLRMSNLGSPCDRKLWYTINRPALREKLPAYTRIKFLYGHILESLLLFFAERAGHQVTGRQTELDIGGVKGHRDAVIDGRTVDVKSATTASFKKFRENRLGEDDPFGYLDQINAYRDADKGNVDDKVSFLAIDKQLGHIVLDTYPANGKDYDALVDQKRAMVEADTPPVRGYEDEPTGAGGNRKLGTNCSYCDFKATCWPNLRTFIYSNGPVYLTKVEREPNVLEVNSRREF
jgi:hypothetical protein